MNLIKSSNRYFYTGVLLISMTVSANADGKTDPKLIQALKQSTYDYEQKTNDLDALLWLSNMSENLVKRIPNAFYRIRLLETIYKQANIHGLDPQLVMAVIDIESNFNRYAQSHVGAQGLMQVMPFWKKEYGHSDDDLFNPHVNISYGCKILRYYLDRYDTTEKALAAYNGSLGKSKYPNKVFARLKKEWQFKEDNYSSQTPESALANH